MTIARRDGRIPFEMIVDRSRQTIDCTYWNDLDHLAYNLDRELQDFRRDYWQDQPVHVEILLEKDAMSGSVMSVVQDYGLILTPVRGFDSSANVYEIAKRLVKARQVGKSAHILYLGDFDPSGTDMERDIKARLEEFMGYVLRDKGDEPDEELCQIGIERVAIFKADIGRYRLPPQRAKDTDPRSKAFRKKHGKQTVELDALRPDILRQRLHNAIDKLIDHVAWDRAKLVEEAQQITCQRYAGMLKKMAETAGPTA